LECKTWCYNTNIDGKRSKLEASINMKIKVLKRKSKERKDFYDKEWEIADKEHWNRVTNWKDEKFYIEAYEDGKIVGLLGMTICARVGKINNIITSHNKRGQGIGKKLMLEAEKLAKKHKVHKIHLTTGKGWVAEEFYNSLGYKKEGLLKKHYFKHDFIQFGKQL